MIAELIESARSRGERVLLVGEFDLAPGPPVADWDLVVNRRLLDVERSGAIGVFDRDRAVAGAVARAPLPSWLTTRVVRVLRRSDAPGDVRTLYAGLPERIDSVRFGESVAAAIAASEPRVVIVAMLADGSGRYGPSYFAPAIVRSSLELVSSRTVADRRNTRIEEYRVRR